MNTSIKSMQNQSSILSTVLAATFFCVPSLLCAVLVTSQPALAQTCMTESLLYTYDDDATTMSIKPAHRKVAKRGKAKVASKTVAIKAAVAPNTTTAANTTAALKTATVIDTQHQIIHISDNSVTAMRNHP